VDTTVGIRPSQSCELLTPFTARLNVLAKMPQLRWLVTGCSSGFGETFARSLLTRGDKVVATTRGDTSRLSALKEAGAETVSLDVTASASDIKAVVDKVLESGPIDVIVNNAGYIEAGIAEETR
jgi:NAD(P)-dependent dehydrogenase (short-subunit alcohol dehydrogenase family)